MSEMRAPRHMTKSDPAPSRWNYRYQRLMLTPLFRRVLRVGVPFTLALGVGLIYFANEARRDGFNLAVAEMRAEFENRPEFMVKLMAIDGATVELAEDIREIVPLDFPLSSFELELETIRQDVAGLQAVKSARVKVKSGGLKRCKSSLLRRLCRTVCAALRASETGGGMLFWTVISGLCCLRSALCRRFNGCWR